MSEDCRTAISIAAHSDTQRVQRPSNQTSPSTAQVPRSLSDFAVRDEAKEVWPDARPQARKNRRRIRWNTLRIFSGRERRRWLRVIRSSRTVNVGQAPRIRGKTFRRHHDRINDTTMAYKHHTYIELS